MRKYFIYSLNDPNLKIPKYIGISNNPERRFKEHLEDSSITSKTKWIKSLKEGGSLPILKVLKDTSDVHEVIKWEQTLIKKLKDRFGLVNSTRGGEYYAIGTPIQEFDMEGNFLDSYNSMIEYTELKGLSPNAVSGISSVCLRKRNYTYNRIFRYFNDTVTEDDLLKLKNSLHNRDPKHFIIVSLNKEILGEFDSIEQAEREGFGKANMISQTLNNVPGYNSVKDNLICNSIEEFDERLKKYISGKSKGNLDNYVSKYDLDGNYIDSYYTYTDAGASLNLDTQVSLQLIKNCCNLKYKQAYGYQWRYGKSKENIGKVETPIKRKQGSPVNQYDKDGNFIKTWSNATEAADALGINRGAINRTANGSQKTTGGYIWKYTEAVQ